MNKFTDPPYTISSLDRCRWNVLDSITIVARGTVPTQLYCEIDMAWAEGLKAKLSERGSKITVTAMLLKSIAIAQRRHPASRTALLGSGRVVTFEHIVAGFTVERFCGEIPAVFFGTVDSPDTKPLTVIMKELVQYRDSDIDDNLQLGSQKRFMEMPWICRQAILWLALRIPKLRLRFMPATFGLTSLGKYGVSAIAGPCVSTSVFGVGVVQDKPVVQSGKIEIRPMMTLSLSFDHRLIDGAAAARFLRDVRILMEGGLEQYLEKEELNDDSWVQSVSNEFETMCLEPCNS